MGHLTKLACAGTRERCRRAQDFQSHPICPDSLRSSPSDSLHLTRALLPPAGGEHRALTRYDMWDRLSGPRRLR